MLDINISHFTALQPNKNASHVESNETKPQSVLTKCKVSKIKQIFYVKTFAIKNIIFTHNLLPENSSILY